MTPEKGASKEKHNTVRIEEGTTIWPERGRMGVVQKGFTAEPLRKKVNRLSGYKAIGNTELYYDGKIWPLLSGAKFGAYAKDAK
jgi:hypothetical protein